MSSENEMSILAALCEISEKLDVTNALLQTISDEASSINSNTDWTYYAKSEIEGLHTTIKNHFEKD